MTGAVVPADIDHCRELAMQPGSVFEFTSRYMPARQLDVLQPLYALRQAVATIPFAHVDDSVKWAKLKWWSEEILADPASLGRHPVLRVLQTSGARSFLTDRLLQSLINDAAMQVDPTPDSDKDAMFARFAALGSTEIKMELALDEAEIDSQNMNLLGAAMVSLQLISGFAAKNRSESERLPLSMLAKHNVTTAQLEQDIYPVRLAQIISDLAGDALDWYSQGLSGLSIKSETGACRHLQLRWQMEKRRLQVIYKNASGYLETGKRYGPVDAWFAWRFLRKLK